MNTREMNNTEQEIIRKRLKERRLFLNLTYEELATKTGMSKSTLQRYETGSIKNLPYDKIFTLSAALEVAPSYFIDVSSDYTGESHTSLAIQDHKTRAEHFKRIKDFELKAIEAITPFLISKGYSVAQRDHGSAGDIIATKGNEFWHIDFMYIQDVDNFPVGTGMHTKQFLLRLGRLAVYEKPITKYSIVIDNRLLAQQLIERYKPTHLNIQISALVLKRTGFEELFFN